MEMRVDSLSFQTCFGEYIVYIAFQIPEREVYILNILGHLELFDTYIGRTGMYGCAWVYTWAKISFL